MNETSKSKERQKADPSNSLKRIDATYIWEEITSVLNFDKGLFYTIRELIIRPGATVKEFLLYDRKRVIKPIFFVVFSSVFFIISQEVFSFQIGSTPTNIESDGIKMIFEWTAEHFEIINIIVGFFIGLWTRLFFYKSKFNIYEILILIFFIMGMENFIYAFLGILESSTGFGSNSIAFLLALMYSSWAMGNFFNKNRALSYIKSLLAFTFGLLTYASALVILGLSLDAIM